MMRHLPTADQRRLIITKGLAPLDRAYAGQPRDPLNFYAARWRERAREAERAVIAALSSEGVEIQMAEEGNPQSTVRIDFAGIRTSSRLGLRMALRNWKAKSEGKRVDGLYRRPRQQEKST